MMIKSLAKTVLLLSVIEIFLFLLLIFTSMTDEKPVLIARFFYFLLKYVFGFPISLLNNEYPFFLDSNKMPTYGFLLIILNNLLIAVIILAVSRISRKVKS